MTKTSKKYGRMIEDAGRFGWPSDIVAARTADNTKPVNAAKEQMLRRIEQRREAIIIGLRAAQGFDKEHDKALCIESALEQAGFRIVVATTKRGAK